MSAPARLVSQLLVEDAELRDIVEEFVQGLSNRLTELRAAHAQLDFDQLALLAHRLKGAAGSYGYPDISHVCAEMEQQFRNHEVNTFDRRLTELQQLVSAATAGLNESSQ